jgi:aspartate/methionine/tyrosine aminotransferase
MDDEDFAMRLLMEQGVIIQPGYLFNVEVVQVVVVSLLTPESEFLEGVQRIARCLSNST